MTAQPIFTLVYLSTLRRLLSRPELVELLAECRDRNATLDVTGLLIIYREHVLQILEGDQHVVDSLHELIAADPRHHAVMTLWTGTADHRRLPDWTMAYEDFAGQLDGAPDPSDGLTDQTPQLASITSDGTTGQQQYVRRRNAALRRALVDGGQLTRTLAVLTHGHDPESVQRVDGTTYLTCRECRILADRDPAYLTVDDYPCPIAVDALQALESSS